MRERIAVIMEGRVGYEREVLLGIREFAARQTDWVLRLELPSRNVRRFLNDWKPDGVLYQSAGVSPSSLKALCALSCPVVHVSDSSDELPVACVGLDNSTIGQTAADYLCERGCENFAFVGLRKAAFSNARQLAFADRLRETGRTVHSFILPGNVWVPDRDTESRLKRWLKKLPKPTGLFAVHDECSLRLVTLCRDEGMTIPDDLAILGADNDTLICELAEPRLSSIAVPSREVGRAAAERLAAFLSKNTRRNRKALLLKPTGVIARQSTDLNQTPNETVNRVLRFISAHFDQRLNVEEILREVGVSRRALERLFKAHIGRSPLQELHRRRVEHAAHLLRSTNEPLHRIAGRCGFSDASQFVRLFRGRMGKTPGKYRMDLPRGTHD